MPDITIDATDLTGGTPLAGASWYVKRKPYRGSLTSSQLLSAKPKLGTLDDDGQSVVELPTSPSATSYVLVIREHGSWEFEVGDVDATVTELISGEVVVPVSSGLPSGGTVGQLIVNTAPGSGEWADPPVGVAFVPRGSDTAYSSADQTLTFTSDLLPPIQLTSVGSVIRFVWPNAIARNRNDPMQIATPNSTNPLKSVDGSSVVPSEITPGSLAELVLLYVGGAYEWRLLGQLPQRPQDYLIRMAAKHTDNVFTEPDFLAGTTSSTDLIKSPLFSVNSYVSFAVPSNSPDVTRIALGTSGLNNLAFYPVQDDALSIDGLDYRVRSGNSVLTAFLSGREWNVGVGRTYYTDPGVSVDNIRD